MRTTTLLLCLGLSLGLGACTTGITGVLGGGQGAPGGSADAAAPAAGAAVAASPPAATPAPAARSSPPPASRGPQSAAQRAAPPQPAADPDALSQARVVCWMQVEEQKSLRNIDRRIAFVDKCIADAMKP